MVGTFSAMRLPCLLCLALLRPSLSGNVNVENATSPSEVPKGTSQVTSNESLVDENRTQSSSVTLDAVNDTRLSGKEKAMPKLRKRLEAAPFQTDRKETGRWPSDSSAKVIFMLFWVCCCSFCCYSATHSQEVRTMILRRNQRSQMAEIAEKEMGQLRHSEPAGTVGLASSFDGLLSSASTYTPPRL
ncbi:unnamed protein product [Durusdinium trenchii]|uniref:Transmembrane protein n=1 Tax=Durusdinium trenchii TaxID=1381693 RepID=A0ABP0PSD9_9DINO